MLTLNCEEIILFSSITEFTLQFFPVKMNMLNLQNYIMSIFSLSLGRFLG